MFVCKNYKTVTTSNTNQTDVITLITFPYKTGDLSNKGCSYTMWHVGVFAVVFAISAVGAQRFHNPVIDGGDFPDPGVIFYEGLYYAATTTNPTPNPNKYPIHTSKDLQNWTLIGHIFNETNRPKWSGNAVEYFAPEIHQVKDKFVCYYTALHLQNNVLAIGVATADHPAGPYTTLDEPLLVLPNVYVLDSTLIKNPENGQLALAWVESQFIRVRNLTDDGLAFKDNIVVPLFQPELPWEGGTVEGPWYIYRNGYHYMFYSGNGFCSENYALGVARCKGSPAGPYEKLSHAVLVSNDVFKGPGHGSIVHDVDGEGWVFVHHAWKAGHVCGNDTRFMFSSTMFWGDDDWPKTMTIGD